MKKQDPIKNKKLVDLFYVLERYLARLPDNQNITVKMGIDEEGVSSGLEARYHQAVSKLPNLSYGVDLIETISLRADIKPQERVSNSVGFQFYDYGEMSGDEALEQAMLYKAWVANQTFRELSETLHHHLLELYDFCIIVSCSTAQLSQKQITELKASSINFQKMGLKERLKSLRKKFKVRTEYTQQLLSLYGARNLFAHWDGVVQEKNCDSKGLMKLLWPENKYKLRKRSNNRIVAYHKVEKPFRSDDYSEIIIEWLTKPKIREFECGTQIELSVDDIHNLIFFYIYVFKELQEDAIEFAKDHNIPVREFEEYGMKVGIPC